MHAPPSQDEHHDERNAPVSDRVVLQKEPPRSDFQVDVKRAGEHMLVALSGRISEDFKGEELGRRLVGNVIFDTRQVDRVTSFGVRAWLAMLAAMDADSVVFARCSDAILSQMTMIRSFSGSGEIASFFAPYLCESCGNAFNVLYDALDDAETISALRAVDAACPSCQTVSTLDDDPASFFQVGPLLTRRPESLASALSKLAPLGKDADPIEKSIRRDLTLVRFNARLDASVRLGRVFDGLEGRVRFELGSIPEVTERGLQSFVRALDALDRDVKSVEMNGCPALIAERLAERDANPRIRVRSVIVPGTCKSPPGQRNLFIDLEEHALELANGREPNIRCDWCDDPLSVANSLHFLKPLARRLGPEIVRVAPPKEEPKRSALPFQLFVGSSLLAASAVLLGLVGIVMLGVVYVSLPETPETGWIAGKTPPPEWTEVVWVDELDAVRVVAGADAAEVEDALADARNAALFQLTGHVHDALRGTPLHGISPRPEGVPNQAIVDAYVAAVTPFGLPERDQVAVRQGGTTKRVFGRYQLSKPAWEKVVAHFSAVHEFRGVSLGHRFPTQHALPPGVPVFKSASFLPEPNAGDWLVRVGTIAVHDLADASAQLTLQWDSLPPGGVLVLTFRTEDGETQVPFSKKATP